MTRLILIRHGESEFNLIKKYTGQLDVALTEKGVMQAELTAKYILSHYKIDKIYSSDLSRAINTAKPIADPLGLEITTDARLREIYAGEWQGLYFEDVRTTYKEEYDKYKSDKINNRTRGGEGLGDVRKRTLESICEIAAASEGKTVLISTHNGPLMTFTAPFLGIALNDMESLANNSITEVEYENGEFKPILVGYSKHLDNLSTNFTDNTQN